MRTLVIGGHGSDALSSALHGVLCNRMGCQDTTIARFEEAETPLAQLPEMVLVLLSPDLKRGLDMLGTVREARPGYLVAVGQSCEGSTILSALHAGADYFVDESDLETGLDAIVARVQNKQGTQNSSGHLVAVLGASGGSGASTVAVNVAATWAKEHGRCALIDLKSGRGDLATLLDLKPKFNLVDLCQNIPRLDRSMFEKMLVAHSSGIQLLAAPQIFDAIRLVSSNGVSQALVQARRLFSHVVVDLEDCFHGEQVLALREASVIVLVSRLDFTSLCSVRRILDHLNQLDIPATRVRLAINRYGRASELPLAEVKEVLGEEQAFCIPDDPKTINGANNMGIPAVLKSPSAKVSQSLAQLARSVLERRKRERSLLTKIFAR